MAYRLVLTTAASRKEARKIAQALLKAKAAACVTLQPNVESHYRWQGKLEKSNEVLLLIKTRASLYGKVETLIRKNHSYDVPEVIALPITRGSAPYLNWLKKETRSQ